MNLIEMINNIDDVELLLDDFRKNETLTNGKVKYIKALVDRIKFIETAYYTEKIVIDYFEKGPFEVALFEKELDINDFYLYVQAKEYLLSFNQYSLFKLSNMSIYWTNAAESHMKSIYFIVYLILNEYINITEEL